MKVKTKTLASSPTTAGLRELIKAYFYGSEYDLMASGAIASVKDGKILSGFEWHYRRNRYFFKSTTKTGDKTT